MRSFLIISLLGLAIPVLAQTATVLPIVMTNVYGVTQQGEMAPQYNLACREKFANQLGQVVWASYSAHGGYPQQAQVTVIGNKVPLYPMGIGGSLDFISDSATRNIIKGLINIALDVNGQHKVVRFLFNGKHKQYNCVVNGALA